MTPASIQGYCIDGVLGIPVALQHGMTPQPIRNTATQSAARLECIPQWETSTITCQLDARDYDSFELCVVPHSDPSLAMFEQFDASKLALQRHAEVTRQLREQGWTVIDHGCALAIRAAA